MDGKILLDDNALFRHFELAEMRDADEETPEEQEARRHGLSYVKLDGEIGCMVNGAGLAMATMDITKLYGGAPANFLDIGGGAQADKVAAALRIILSDPNVKAVLFNIFGGITRCDEVAKGILAALREVPTHGADGRPAGGHQRRRGPGAAGQRQHDHRRHAGRGRAKGRRRAAARRSCRHEHPGQQRHAVGGTGHHRPGGRVPHPADDRLWHERRGRHHARQGRGLGGRRAGLRHGA